MNRPKMNIKKWALLATAGVVTAGGANASAQVFTPGDLVVTVYGDLNDSSLQDGALTPITLQEYSVTGTSASLVFNDQLPTTDTGSNVGIVGEYGSSSEGTLQLSGNGQYLTIGGYDGNIATQSQWGDGSSNPALAQSTDTAVPRVAATIDANGNVNTSTVLNDVYNTNNPRAVYSVNGSSFYISGQGAGKSDEGGLYLVSKGTNTTQGGAAPQKIYNTVSTRTVTAYNGNLYYAADQNSSKGVQTGIFEYTGLPTTDLTGNAGTRLTPASGVVNGRSVNFSPEAFAFANSTTMYVADTGDPKAGGNGDGGIQKWSLNGSTWTLDYTLTPSNFSSGGETGFEAMTLQVVGDTVDIYAVSYTANDAAPNGLYGIVDSLSSSTGAGDTVTELEKAPGIDTTGKSQADFNFKGVAFAPQAAPEPSETLLLGLALAAGAAFAWKRKNSQKA